MPWKRIDGVIDAVAELPEMSLVIIGEGPDQEETNAVWKR
jgi:glycosyltransferase involved in cell wall biosynthesis